MNKNKNKKEKALALSLMLTMGLMSPLATNAQQYYGGNRGLFGRGINIENSNRDGGMEWSDGGMTPQDPTQEVPLSSELLILMAAGASFAALKRKEDKQ